ncbi:MAG TPA: thioredoxin family protein [Bacteroidales bacterium]|nr:thioredoxin family protein [Bacteroidales bacterium]
MKRVLLIIPGLLMALSLLAQDGLDIDDKAVPFSLKDVSGEMISLDDYNEASKGAIVIFTCNHCPYAKAYEQRIVQLDKQFRTKGVPVIAINPNDPELVPEDSYEEMQKRAKEKNYPFPYLIDETQEVYKAYGATRTPHVFLLKKENDDFYVSYIGTIDNNYKSADEVTEMYLANAVKALLKGEVPSPQTTKAIGCSIKDKN